MNPRAFKSKNKHLLSVQRGMDYQKINSELVQSMVRFSSQEIPRKRMHGLQGAACYGKCWLSSIGSETRAIPSRIPRSSSLVIKA